MFDNVKFTLASAVADSGTVTVGYPDGRSQGNYDWSPGKHVLFVAGNKYTAPADFTLTFNVNASDITLTNASGVTWPKESACHLQIDKPGPEDKNLDALADETRGRQLPLSLQLVDLGSPDTADADGYVKSQNLTSAGVFSTDTTAAAAIAAAALAGEADVPRNVVASWTTTAVLTVTGEDEYGNVVVESSASGTSLTGKKAFKKVTDVETDTNITNLTVGTGDVLGLPFAVQNEDQVVATFLDGTRQDKAGGKEYLTFELDDISTESSTWLPSPVAGRVTKVSTILHGAISGADAAITMEVNDTAVNGLSITVANGSSAAGDVDTDTPTAGHASTVVAVGDKLEILSDGGSTTAARLTVVVEIDTSVGIFTAAVGTEATATTGDVRGTFEPLAACDGDDGYMLLISAPNPADKGVAQYAG